MKTRPSADGGRGGEAEPESLANCQRFWPAGQIDGVEDAAGRAGVDRPVRDGRRRLEAAVAGPRRSRAIRAAPADGSRPLPWRPGSRETAARHRPAEPGAGVAGRGCRQAGAGRVAAIAGGIRGPDGCCWPDGVRRSAGGIPGPATAPQATSRPHPAWQTPTARTNRHRRYDGHGASGRVRRTGRIRRGAELREDLQEPIQMGHAAVRNDPRTR